MTFTVQTSEDQYRIVASTGEESSTVAYADEPAVLALGGDIYYCLIVDPDEEAPTVFKVDSVSPCHSTVEDVEFSDDDDDDDEPVGPVLVETEDAG